MKERFVTVDKALRHLAQQWGVPDSFVEQVRALFQRKGIDLEEDAEPTRRWCRRLSVKRTSGKGGLVYEGASLRPR